MDETKPEAVAGPVVEKNEPKPVKEVFIPVCGVRSPPETLVNFCLRLTQYKRQGFTAVVVDLPQREAIFVADEDVLRRLQEEQTQSADNVVPIGTIDLSPKKK